MYNLTTKSNLIYKTEFCSRINLKQKCHGKTN